MKKEITNPVLRSWNGLNEAIMEMDEKSCTSLLAEEKKGRARKQFLKRIHSRINLLRAQRERTEIEKL